AGGKLDFEPEMDSSDSYDEYVSDPAKPVPFIDKIAIGMLPEYMVGDQRFAGRRTDVLVFETGTEKGPHHRRTDPSRFACLHHRHRFGLDRQADRRVSRRLSRPGS